MFFIRKGECNIKKRSITDCHKLAKRYGGKCLSKKYINAITKILWECKDNHCWYATFDNVNHNHWCPKCAIKNNAEKQKLINGLYIARRIAEKRGGKCLSNEYVNSKIKMHWECEIKHTWWVKFTHIQQGHWCPKCSFISLAEKNRSDGLKIAQQIATELGGECLSEKYTNCDEHLEWKCKNEHKWSASLYNVKNNKTWCPECHIFRNQNFLSDMMKDIFPRYTIRNNYRGFEWLANKSGHKQELDIYIEEIKLAIEYDGQQHFMPINFGGCSERMAKENLKKTKRLDKIKNKKVKQHSEDIEYFIRFNYNDNLSKENIISKLKANGIVL